MIRTRLEEADLTPDEAAVLSIFLLTGSVQAIGFEVRGDFISQLCEGEGPIGAIAGIWRRVHLEGLQITDSVDLADRAVGRSILFKNCAFEDPDISFDSSRSQLYDLRFSDCTFMGDMRMENCTFQHNLIATDCYVNGSWTLYQSLVSGTAQISSVAVAGRDKRGFSFDGATVIGALAIRDSLFYEGVTASYAEFQSNVSIESSIFHDSLSLDSSEFDHDVRIGPGVDVYGLVMIPGIRVGKNVTITGLRVVGRRGTAVQAELAEVRGAFLVSEGNSFSNALKIGGASVGRFEMSSTRIRVPKVGDANVAADGITIAQDLRLGPNIATNGEMRFLGAEVRGQFAVVGDPVRTAIVFNGEGMNVRGAILLDEADPRSNVFLADATMSSLLLDVSNPPIVSLARTRYQFVGGIDGVAVTGRQATRLLEGRLLGFSIAPYVAMAGWLRSQGDDDGARRLSIAGEKAARSSLGLIGRSWGQFLNVTVGYGYRPSRAIYWLIGLIAVSSVLFGLLYNGELLWNPLVQVTSSEHFLSSDPAGLFNPLTFAVAAIFPAGAEWLTTWRPISLGPELVTLVLRVLGWVLVSSVVVGLANRLRR